MAAQTIVMNVNPVKLEEIDIEEAENGRPQNSPWSVEDASVFLNYCCPECDYKHQDLNVFSEHALDNHINSVQLFGAENYHNVINPMLFDINKFDDYFDSEDNKDDLFEHMQTDDKDITNTFVYPLNLPLFRLHTILFEKH